VNQVGGRPRVDAGELIRQGERVAARVGVVGPRLAARLAAREAPEARQMLDHIRSVLQQLADLGADAEGRARRPVPVLDAHALADQLMVFVHDVAVFGQDADRAAAHAVLRDLAARL